MGSLVGMEFTYTQSYNGSPERVAALMRNEEFISDVATHAGATRHSVSIDGDTTRLDMTLSAPADLSKFIGNSFDLVQTIAWGEPDAAGVRRGKIDVDVRRLPVSVNATGALRPDGDDASIATIGGELKVNIPLVGKKVERQVEPFIAEAFAGLERRAREWLARGPQAE